MAFKTMIILEILVTALTSNHEQKKKEKTEFHSGISIQKRVRTTWKKEAQRGQVTR